jgi:hypothetical protein
MLRSVWSFGTIQLAGLVGMNAAGWWLTSLVAKSDPSMVQMGFFAVAHQLRNMVALAPGLLTESGLAVMAYGEQDPYYAPDQVMAACTFVTTFASFFLAGLGIVIVPWVLVALYGKSYSAASAAGAIALATAVIHMGSGPASARLSIVSIRLTGIVNTLWAIFVTISATLFFLSGTHAMDSSAWEGALIYLAAHLISAGLVLGVLARKGCVPDGMIATVALASVAVLTLTGLALCRTAYPEQTLPISLVMLALCLLSLANLLRIGKHHRWTPTPTALKAILKGKGLFPSLAAETPNSGGFNA